MNINAKLHEVFITILNDFRVKLLIIFSLLENLKIVQISTSIKLFVKLKTNQCRYTLKKKASYMYHEQLIMKYTKKLIFT